MKRPLKISLLALTGVVAVGGFLWMRALASWRPQRVAVLPPRYTLQYLSSDASVGTMIDWNSKVEYEFQTCNLVTGQFYPWPHFHKTKNQYIPIFGWDEPFFWNVVPSDAGEPQAIELQDLRYQTTHTLPWKNYDVTTYMDVETDNKTARVLTANFFRVFDLTRDRLTREVKLQSPIFSSRETNPRYAIGSDGKFLVGCLGKQGKVWEALTGKLRSQWVLDAPKDVPPDPDLFSPDGRTAVFRRNFKWFFTDSTTGKVRWTADTQAPIGHCFFPETNEIAILHKTNCEIRDVTTGRVLRQLPGPTLSNPDVIRVTHDTIYTHNLKGEILRWRAR